MIIEIKLEATPNTARDVFYNGRRDYTKDMADDVMAAA